MALFTQASLGSDFDRPGVVGDPVIPSDPREAREKSAMPTFSLYPFQMRHHRQRCFGEQTRDIVKRGLGWAATAKGLWDIGQGVLAAGRYIAPFVAPLLL